MIFRLIFLLLFFISTISYAQEPQELGLFVWALDQKVILASKTQIDQLIDFAKTNKIKSLYVQVYRANRAWFKTKHADTTEYDSAHRGSKYDSFSYLIAQAHLYDIEVHAWMNMLSLSANQDAPILKKYGTGILTRNVKEKKVLEDYKIDKQFFLEPSDPKVRKELLAIVEDLLKAHKDLDGIQFDYIRYPDVHPFYGYSPDNIKRFKKATGVKQIVEDDPKWKQWKRDQVTELLKALVHKTRSISPKIHISTTGCLSYGRALNEALQDWPSWIASNLTEFVTVMNYPPNYPEFEGNIAEVRAKTGDLIKINVAVGAYKFIAHPEVFKKQYEACEVSGARGCIIFHYSNLLENTLLGEVLKSKD